MSSQRPSIWLNPELHIRFLELREFALTAREIARRLSAEFDLTITHNAVIGRARRSGLSRRIKTIEPLTEPAPLLAPILPLEIELPVSVPRTLIELGENACHYPVGYRTGEYGEQLHVFCGLPANNVRYYCDEHHRKVYVKVRDLYERSV